MISSQSIDTTTPEPTSHRRHFRPLTVVLAVMLVTYWLALFVGTHIPIPKGFLQAGGDKVVHCASYAGLAVLLLGLRASRGSFGRRSVILRWALLAAYGAFDELTQLLVGRQGDVLDWCADILGALCGLALVVLFVWFFMRHSNRVHHESFVREAA